MVVRHTVNNYVKAQMPSFDLKCHLFFPLSLSYKIANQYLHVLFSWQNWIKNPVEGFSAGLIDDNDLYRWEVLIIGPPDTL